MSERVTWEQCPRCGLPAAVGWVTAPGFPEGRFELLPAEFDCPWGCTLDRNELWRAFRPDRGQVC